MSTDREFLRTLVQAAEQVPPHLAPRALRLAREAARLHLAQTSEPRCTCGTPGLDYDGPRVDCDRHGSPSEAFDAGRREGAQDERDQQRIRGVLCRWCHRQPQQQLGEVHGTYVHRSPDPDSDPEVTCLDAEGHELAHGYSDAEVPF